MKIIVVHESYGCDSGCCGHIVKVDGDQVGDFEFRHPRNDTRKSTQAFVRDLVTKECGKEHVKDIDWAHCIVLDE